MAHTITFGLVRETLPRERRVALTPHGAEALIAEGHAVLVESGAGVKSGFDDDDYKAVGSTICMSPREVVSSAAVLLKIHGPTRQEDGLLAEGGTITGFLHLSSGRADELRRILRSRKINAVAWELVEETDGSRPVLEAVSAIGGRVAILLASKHLLGSGGGAGRLMGGAPGVPPMNVVIIGAGAAGEAAAREAQQLGAQVTILDKDSRALSRVTRRIQGIVTAVASRPHLTRMLAQADVLVTAVASPGRPAPKIVTRKHVRSMPQGSIIIDMSVDEGGSCETTRQEPEPYVEEGVRHISTPNLPSEVAQTASIAFTNATLPYLLALGSYGAAGALSAEPGLYRGAVYVEGQLRNSVVAELTGEPLGA